MGLVLVEDGKVIKKIKRCCPDCGSMNNPHYSWCRIHLTPVAEYDKQHKEANEIRKKLLKHLRRKRK